MVQGQVGTGGRARAFLTSICHAIISTEAERWSTRKVTTRIADLQDRLTQLLLGKVVERYSPDVRTQSVKGVAVEDEDYKTV
jgi:hypothetical protein